MNIILCGLPSSGKTTIGKLTAETLGYRFIDSDHLIESAYKTKTESTRSCRQIFQLIGEPSFRSLEQEQIATLTGSDRCVIAIGGGTLSNPNNAQCLSKLGLIFYLKASPTHIWNRIKQNVIPAFLNPDDPENSFYSLAIIRTKQYESFAKFTIEIDNRSRTEIVEEILKSMEQYQYG